MPVPRFRACARGIAYSYAAVFKKVIPIFWSASKEQVGLMADALYSPYMQGYCFLVVGNTDAVGTREYNFKLSQQRADAIRDALINPFAIKPARIEAVGLGEENLINPANPKATENRRVQLINLGKLGANATCPNRPEQILR